MSKGPGTVFSRPARLARRMLARVAAVTLLMSAVTAGVTVHAPHASAAGTVLFNQPFHDHSVDGPAGSVSLPTAPVGTNSACLTASGNATKNPIASCTSSTDSQGSGKLRLTPASTTQEGGVFASTSVPTSQGLDATFSTYQYGGSSADGIAFVLAAVNPANPAVPSAIGQSGGALGYSAQNGNTNGLSYGYLGVGLDTFGNFSNRYEGSGCTDPPNIATLMPGQVVVRGPGNSTVGYCALQSSAATASSPPLALRAAGRAGSLVPVEVVFNPTSSPVTTASGLTVPAGDYDVTFTPVGGTAKSLVGALPVVPSGLYPASWVNTNGIPKQLAFGWVASTGGSTDFHEIDNVTVSSINPVPQLAVSQTSYTAATLAPGSPVTYTVAASSSGAAENQPVTVTETLPSGVLPAGASGSGWVCGAPSGQQISCTNSTSPFTSGAITVSGVVTSSSVTPALVQSASSVVASSADASPATSPGAPAGTIPAAPTITSISPTNGAAGGGNDVKLTGTGLDAATAIEIGTTAQFTAGTPTTVMLCAASAPGCFTVINSTSLDISAMPGHTAAGVTVKVITLGTSASTAYTYNPGPALLFPAPPGGEAGVSYSDQLTVTGGTSPFTWSVSAGTLPAGVTLNASTGLLSGTPTTAGSYSFTVKVTDGSGLSDTEPVTLAVIAGPSLSFPAPPPGWTRTVYSDTLTESGGTSPFAWSVSSGSLPAGISLSPSGNLSGTPTATGTFSFTVKVTDANGQIATEATSITVSAGVSTTFSAPSAATVGGAYTDTLTATGGTTPYTWSVNSGTLPAGITLSTAGVLSGTPAATGTYVFSVNVIDANNGIATTSITLVVGNALTLTFAAPPSGTVGTAYTDTLTAAGGTTPYSWSVSAGTLPTGLTLNASTGVISGTPTTAGTSNFTVKVADAKNGTAVFATSITILTAGMLTIAVTASPATVAPGGTVSYTITATNTGQVALTGATFTDALSDVLDDASYNSNAAATAGSVSFASPALSWTGNLAAGATATITFSVTVNNPDTGNKTLASTITSATTSSNCASSSTDARCASRVGVSVLTIAMTASTTTATPGTAVGYTVTVTNAGTVAYTGAALAVSLAGVLDDAGYNNDGTATVGSVTYSRPNLAWSGNLAVGASATVTFSVTVSSPDTGDKVLAAAVTSGTAGSNCPAGSPDAHCAASVSVLTPGLTIAMSAGNGTTNPGSVVQYTVTVTNTGQTAYTGATFTSSLSGVLPNAVYNNNASATAGSVSYSSPNLTWTGNLAVGASATITYSITVNNPDTGDKTLITTVTSATAGSNCASGSTDARCKATVTDLVPGLEIAVSAGSGTTPGSVVHYTVTVTNSGQTAYAGAAFTDPLGEVLDDAVYNNDASATAGSVSFASPNLTWTGPLAVGAAATVTFSVTVKNPDTGNKILSSTITSATAGSNCGTGSTDPSCTATVDVAVLTITNTSSVSTTTPGSVVRFTAVFANTGQVPYTGITIASSTSDVVDDATPDGDQTATDQAGHAAGTLTLTATAISWTGSIPVGGTVTVTGTVTVNNPDTGNKVLASTLSTAAAGSNCGSGSADPRCSVSVAVLVPGLGIVTTADAAAAVPGQQVRFTVTITDTGQSPYSGAVVTETLHLLDDAVYNNDAAATGGGVSYAAPVLTWTGDLSPGQVVTVTYTVTVGNPDTGDKLLAVTSASTVPGSACPPGSPAAGCSLTVPVLTPALTITKTANVATAVPGQQVIYTITVADSGQTPYTGATVTDNLAGVIDAAAYNNDATAPTGTLSYASPTLTWTGNLTAGQTVTITYSATVHNPHTGGASLANTVTSAAAGSNCTAGSTDPRCTVTIPLVGLATLTLTQSTDVSSATAGSVVHYTVTVANSGASDYLGAAFTESLAGVLSDAAYNNDASASTGLPPVFTSPNLTWTGTVSARGSVTITFSVTVNTPDTGGKILASTLTGPAGSNCPSGGTDPRCASTVTVSQLTFTSTANVTTTVPGGVVRYTTTLANTGQTPYFGITMTAAGGALPGDVTSNGDETASSGTLSVGATGAVWTGNIPVGQTVTLAGSVTVNNPDTGGHLIAETNTSDAPGSNCPTGVSTAAAPCGTSIPVLTPGLTLTQAANATSAVPGQQVRFTVTIADTGQTPYTGVSVTDTLLSLDDAAYNNDAVPSAGAVVYAAPVLTWTGDLTPHQVVTVTYSVTVNNPDTGDKVLGGTLASAAAGSGCPPASGNPACDIAIPVLTPALTITKTASTPTTVPGGTVSYTITVTDTGQTSYTGAAFTDNLSGVIDDAAYNAGATATTGSLSYTSPVLSWAGALDPGGTATITYSVTVRNPDASDTPLANTVTSATPGSNCAAGSADPRCTVTVGVASLTIVNAANVPTTTPGSTVGYTITITNTGQTSYDGATVTVPLAGVTDDAAYNADAATTAGSVSYTAPNLTWTGDLSAGQAAVVTLTVTVNTPDTGDKSLTSTVTSPVAGSTCPPAGPASACTATVTVQIPALSITKSASTATTTPGSAVGYTITVTDTGPTSYAAATVTDNLSGVLADAAYNATATATTGSLSYTSPVLSWTGALTPGQVVTIAYTVTVNNPDTGDKQMFNTVTSSAPGSTCPPGGISPACTTTVTDLIPALTITKTATVSTATPGSTVAYTITVTDTGQTPYTGATVTDNLSGVLSGAAYNNNATASTSTGSGSGSGSGSGLSYTRPVLTWTGGLTVNQAVTITYTVTVNNPYTGGATLANTAVSSAPGSSCPAASRSPGCTATVTIAAGPLSLTAPATADLGSAAPGGTLSAGLGTVQVTDDRGFGAGWTATVSSTSFATGTGTPAETIPASNTTYTITALSQATRPATFTPVPVTQLSTGPQPVVTATSVTGNTTVTWNPTIRVTIPPSAVGGTYTATITHSVS